MQHVTQQLFSLSALFSLFVPEKASRSRGLHLLYIYPSLFHTVNSELTSMKEVALSVDSFIEGVKRTVGGVTHVVFRLTV